jgi:ABC-2 type transport system permease protein
MNWALLRKNIADARWLLTACGLYCAGFAILRVFVVSQFDSSRFKALLDLIPDTFKSFTPVDFDWVISYTGRIALTLDEPMLIGCVALWAIARGSDVVSGELSRGTMEMLLAQPVSRRAVFCSQSAITILGVLLIAAATWLGMYVGVQFSSVEETIPRTAWQNLIAQATQWLRQSLGFAFEAVGFVPHGEATQTVLMRERVNCWTFWPGLANLVCFGFFLAGFTALFSALDRHRWRTIGIVTGIYTVMAMFKFAGMSLHHAGWCLWLTFFTFFEPEQAIAIYQKSGGRSWQWLNYGPKHELLGTGTTLNNVALIALGLTCYWIGLRVFSRRDLPAPL